MGEGAERGGAVLEAEVTVIGLDCKPGASAPGGLIKYAPVLQV